MLHLTSITQRLPLRILQPLARTGESKAASDILQAVNVWARAENGQIARRTAWHAGQIFALTRIGTGAPLDLPVEPMCLFYSTLVLLVYSRGLRSSANGTAAQDGESPLKKRERVIVLDRAIHRSDAELVEWIASGEGTVILELIGDVRSPGFGEKLLRRAGEWLKNLRVWMIGELLSKSLLELAEAEVNGTN